MISEVSRQLSYKKKPLRDISFLFKIADVWLVALTKMVSIALHTLLELQESVCW